MLKNQNKTNQIPHRIKDLTNRENYIKSFLPNNRKYNEEDWYIYISSCVDYVFNRGENAEVTDLLTSYILQFFKERRLFPDWFFENIEHFEETDLDYYYEHIKEVINTLFISNNYKYHGLFESTILEFNPLWNVDGVETTVRTLEQDGTLTVNDTGTDANAHTGTVTDNETGTDTNAKTGTDTLLQTGTDANAHTGTVTDAETGTDTNVHTGTQRIERDADNTKSHDETNSDVNSTSPFNDNAFYNKDKREGAVNYDEGEIRDETDLTTYNETNAETKNLQNQRTYADTTTDTKNLSDARTYNLQDLRTANLQNQRTFNDTATETKNLQSLTTRDLLDTERIILERHGNIGITTTTKLLTEFREYVLFNFCELVAHDVVNAISYGVY